jgi:hypothetical protein
MNNTGKHKIVVVVDVVLLLVAADVNIITTATG